MRINSEAPAPFRRKKTFLKKPAVGAVKRQSGENRTARDAAVGEERRSKEENEALKKAVAETAPKNRRLGKSSGLQDGKDISAWPGNAGVRSADGYARGEPLPVDASGLGFLSADARHGRPKRPGLVGGEAEFGLGPLQPGGQVGEQVWGVTA